MDEYIGYEKNEKSDNSNNRNGYSEKNIKGIFGKTQIKIHRDRYGEFEPIIVEKNQSNVSMIESAIINLYAKGNSTRDIVKYIEEIYKFKLDPTSISRITDKIIPDIQAFQSKPLKDTYAIVFIVRLK